MKNIKPKEEKITIDKLAIMIQEGFMATAKQEDLLALTKRVERLENRMDKFEGRMDKLEGQMDKLEGRMDKFENSVNERFDKLLSELKEIRKEIKMNNLKTQGDIASLDFRIGKLEKKVGL
jgi:DNA anti-recombination protein RmuC